MVAGFRGTNPHGLTLEIGDTVQILEKCEGKTLFLQFMLVKGLVLCKLAVLGYRQQKLGAFRIFSYEVHDCHRLKLFGTEQFRCALICCNRQLLEIINIGE